MRLTTTLKYCLIREANVYLNMSTKACFARSAYPEPTDNELLVMGVQTGVIMLEYINQLRMRRYSVEDAAVEGAVLRLRPIMMTMLVATLGLLPAALSHAIGSDSQRPFAIVIVGGLIAALVMSIFLLPTLYVWIAGDHDVLPAADGEFAEGEHID